jgi:hypothetical protein
MISFSRSTRLISVASHTTLALMLFLPFVMRSVEAAQAPPTPQRTDKRTGSIKGRVVDETGQPMANVVVDVRPAGGTYEDKKEAASDDNGEFVVDHLPVRPYIILCEASGYIRADTYVPYYLIGEPVTITMTKGGVITGKVSSDSGQPIVRARVGAIRVRDENGQPLSLSQGSDTAETDDRGVYRIYGLESGYYLVDVEQPGQHDDSKLRNAVQIYYPSVTQDGARQVAVSRGQEVGGIDIGYRSEPGHIVSGRFSGEAPRKPGDGVYISPGFYLTFKVYIKLIGAKAGFTLQYANKENPAFAFYAVPDGDYYLIAQDDNEASRAASLPYPLKVKGADISGIDLRLVTFGSVSGRVTMEPVSKPASNPECKGTRAGLVQEAVVWAARDEKKNAKEKTLAFPPAFFDPPDPIAPGDKGEFLFKGLAPGHYRLGASPVNEAVYVMAVSMAGPAGKQIDIASAGANLKSRDQLAGISIVLADGAAAVRGRVLASGEKAKLPSGLGVHLVPAEPERANEMLRYVEAEVKHDGAFALTNIAPGRYRVVTTQVTDHRAAPAAWDAEERASLRRRAEVGHTALLELRPCQRVRDYVVSYP